MAIGDYRYFAQCSGFDARDENALCCGTDYTCCNSTAAIITIIPKFTTLSRAAGIPRTTSDTETSSSTITTPRTSTSTAATESNSSSDRSLVFGAGVGIPLGVALLVTLGLLAWQVRKYRVYKRAVEASLATTVAYGPFQQKPGPAELDTPQTLSELPTN